MIDYSKNPRAQHLIKYINGTNRHVFLTGKAGTGKTTLLKFLVRNTHKKVLVAAPTGIAAINAEGVTLHSLFHLPFGTFLPSNNLSLNQNINTQITTPSGLIKNLKMNTRKRDLIREMELLIIDEVSMLRADLLDAIDNTLRHVRRIRNVPFGGLQILFIGDLLQLPPVVKRDEIPFLDQFYPSPYFFNALALNNNQPVYIELEHIFRQSDRDFIEILNNFRTNNITHKDIRKLNQCYEPDFTPSKNDGFIHLTTHNRKADAINKAELDSLKGKTYSYKAKITGDFNENSYPVEPVLELKKGAQVMFIKNDYSGESLYFNGKIGTVSHLDEENIEVSFNDGSPSATVEPYTWENKKFRLNSTNQEIEENIIGTFQHFPIKLAWAITIHKSQGLTFEKAIIDISDVFAGGQAYVALSRLTSLEGLKLNEPISSTTPEIDQALFDFEKQKKHDIELEAGYKKASIDYVLQESKRTFMLAWTYQKISEHLETYNKDERKSAKQKFYPHIKKLHTSIRPLLEVSEKFQNQLAKIGILESEKQLDALNERVRAAKKYFSTELQTQLDNLKQLMTDVAKESGVKKYLRELQAIEGLFLMQLQKMEKLIVLLKAVNENTDLNKSTFDEVIKPIEVSQPEKTKKDKKEKGETQKKSFELFKKGKSIEEIAEERSLAVNTIEGHLSTYVAKGKLKATEFVDKEKFEPIIEAAKELDTLKLGPIKNYLGEDFSYTEIRFVMAEFVFNRFVKE